MMCRRVFNKTLILLGLAGYEMITPRWLYIVSYPARPCRIIAFSRNERTHPNLVSQAREIEICGLQIGRPNRFLQGLWASFSCPSITSWLLFFVASFVVFDFLGVSLKLTGF